jgi:serine/threonine protein kinase
MAAQPPQAPRPAIQQREQLIQGRYQLLRQIGAGKMSSVHEALDSTRGDLPVALKLVNDTLISDHVQMRWCRGPGAVIQLGYQSPY